MVTLVMVTNNSESKSLHVSYNVVYIANTVQNIAKFWSESDVTAI